MKIKNNFKWDIESLAKEFQIAYRIVQEDARTPYGFIMHPETIHSIMTSDEYFKQYGRWGDMGRIFGMKYIGDVDMNKGEWRLLVYENK